MRNPFGFFTGLRQQPLWVTVWVYYLMMINLASLWFWDELLAKIIFFTFMLSAILMMALYSRFGFEKILGLGHVFWAPLLAYIYIEIPDVDNLFSQYLTVFSISIFISLLFDVVDVWKYFANRKYS